MSRIGKMPIAIPSGVEVKIDGQVVSVKGPKGTLTHTVPAPITVAVEDGSLLDDVAGAQIVNVVFPAHDNNKKKRKNIRIDVEEYNKYLFPLIN